MTNQIQVSDGSVYVSSKDGVEAVLKASIEKLRRETSLHGGISEVLDDVHAMLRAEDVSNLSDAESMTLSVTSIGFYVLARTEWSPTGINVLYSKQFIVQARPLVAAVFVHEGRHVHQFASGQIAFDEELNAKDGSMSRSEAELDALDYEDKFLAAMEKKKKASFVELESIRYRRRGIQFFKRMFEFGLTCEEMRKCMFNTPDLLLKTSDPEIRKTVEQGGVIDE